MSPNYPVKTLRIVPTGAVTMPKFHLGQKYANDVVSHNLLRGDVTRNILFTDNKVVITHTKNECLKKL